MELYLFEGVGEQGRQVLALDVDPGASVRDLAQRAGACLERIGLVTVDGRVRHIDYRVRTGQRVCLFPHVMGGKGRRTYLGVSGSSRLPRGERDEPFRGHRSG